MRQRWRQWLLALALVTGCSQAPTTDVEVSVREVGFDRGAGAPVVILETRQGGRVLPIWIGTAEAQAIAMEMRRIAPRRPMTHDLLKGVLERVGVTLLRVRITSLRRQTFFATLILDQGGRILEVDSRPSDAIALALRFGCPIMVAPGLLRPADGAARPARVPGRRIQTLIVARAEPAGLARGARGRVRPELAGG